MIVTSIPFVVTAKDGDTLTLGAPDAYGELSITIKEIVKTNLEAHKFTAKIENESGKFATVDLTAVEDTADRTMHNFTASIAGIPSGEYTLTISAPYYMDYVQPLEFSDNCLNITLYNDDSVNYGRPKDSLFGVIAYGNIDDVNDINKKDADAMAAAINEGSTETEKYDLNGDGEINLIDLSYITRNMDGSTLATPVTSASSLKLKANAKVEKAESTNISIADPELEGKGDDEILEAVRDSLLSADTSANKVVSLAPASGDKISEEAPAEIALDIAGAVEDTQPNTKPENAVETEAITIVPPSNSENKIADGVMTIEAAEETPDGKYKDITIEAPLKDTTGEEEQLSPDKPEQTQPVSAYAMKAKAAYAAKEAEPAQKAKETAVESDGTIVINLGKKVAIKKISIRVTETTAKDGKLCDIAKVEFLGNFAERIPEPKLSIPTIDPASVSNTQGEYKALTFSWSRQTNITGYEVSIVGKGVNVTRTTDDTTYTFQSDKNIAVLQSFEDYVIKVRSVSGDWKSEWSSEVKHKIGVTVRPENPENVVVTEGVGNIRLSWKAVYDTQSWIVYYRNVAEGGEFQKVEVNTPSYTILGKGGETYEAYIVGKNIIGLSSPSITVQGTIRTGDVANMPAFHFVNPVDKATGKADNKIEKIEGKENSNTFFVVKEAEQIPGNVATPDLIKEVLTDNNPSTYVEIGDWDSGVSYDHNLQVPRVTLTEKITFDMLAFTPKDGAQFTIQRGRIHYRDSSGKMQWIGANIDKKADEQNRPYYLVTLAAPITTDYFEVGMTASGREMTMSELRIYQYNPTFYEVQGLFRDTKYDSLADRANTTKESLAALREKAALPDSDTGVQSPRLNIMNTLIDQAEAILERGEQNNDIKITQEISSSLDGHMQNALALSPNQPLGYVAAEGDTINVWVSEEGNSSFGSATNLYLVATQFHPESNAVMKEVKRLYLGSNEITIPNLINYQKEHGGALYVEYKGNRNIGKSYNVKVLGATEIPMLNVTTLTGDADRDAAYLSYVKELDEYVNNLETLHGQLHTGSDKCNYDYDKKECFLNSTELNLNGILISVPAEAVRAALAQGAPAQGEERYTAMAARLKNAVDADEQMIDVLYQHNGLNKSEPTNSTNRYPTTRTNARYCKMFVGAFMYAGGKHIGIEYDSVGGLFGTNPVKTDDNGKYQSGNFTGWGIAHEIGHTLNTKGYQITEVTNNLFSQVAQASVPANENFRLSDKPSEEEAAQGKKATYETIWKEMIAGTTHVKNNLSSSLAFFWQLHLAYDTTDYYYKNYESLAEQLENKFYARLDSYYRNPATFKLNVENTDPATKDETPTVALTLDLSSDKDNNFMMAACAAAEKDILDFFRAWGLTPDAKTVEFASKLPKEERLIQYVDDDANAFALENKSIDTSSVTVSAEITNSKQNSVVASNKVNIKITANDASNIQGYEIKRGDKVITFIPACGKTEITYTDNIATENNRAFVYTVTAVDKLLNAAKTVKLDEIKVKGEPVLDKTLWTATSTTNTDGETVQYDESTSLTHTDGVVYNYGALIDSNPETVLTAENKEGLTSVTINLGKTEQISALKYTPGGENQPKCFTILVSNDGDTWTVAKEITDLQNDKGVVDNKDGSYNIFFTKTKEDGTTDPFMYTYDASAIQIFNTATGDETVFAEGGSKMSIAEIDLLGPINDNIDFGINDSADLKAGFGVLNEKYVYAEGADDDGNEYAIPKDALVFFGNFTGDPAYSAVILRDGDGNILSGDQIILAEVPAEGYLGETNDGAWIYWLTDSDGNLLTKDSEAAKALKLDGVQAELYRVQDAMTLEGQRMTSNTLHITADLENAVNVTFSGDDTMNNAKNDYAKSPEAAAIDASDFVPAAKAYALRSKAYGATSYAAAAASDPSDDQLTRQPVILTTDEAAMTATFNIYSTTNPYALRFDMNLNTYKDKEDGKGEEIEGTGAVISEITLDETKYSSDKFYTAKFINDGGKSATVMISSMAGGIDTDFEGTVQIKDGREPKQGRALAYLTSNGFRKTAQTYQITDVDCKVEAGFLLLCQDHVYQELKLEPTCQTEGAKRSVCEFCGAVDEINTKILPKSEHVWGKEVKTDPPTCTEPGRTYVECVNCHEIHEESVIPASSHVDSDGNGLCDKCGADLSEKCTCICHKNSVFSKVIRFVCTLLTIILRPFGKQVKCCDDMKWYGNLI